MLPSGEKEKLFFVRRQLEHHALDVCHSAQSFAANVALTNAEQQRGIAGNKLLKLIRTDETKQCTVTTTFVQNLLSRQIFVCEVTVLAKGHSFSVTTTRQPLPKIGHSGGERHRAPRSKRP